MEKWVEKKSNVYYFQSFDFVYGSVKYDQNVKWTNNKWRWVARIIGDCLPFVMSGPIEGYAPTLKNAQKIVETLCYETNTIRGKTSLKEDDLSILILHHVENCQTDIPTDLEEIYNIFSEKGEIKLKEMIDVGVILEVNDGTLRVNKEYKNDY